MIQLETHSSGSQSKDPMHRHHLSSYRLTDPEHEPGCSCKHGHYFTVSDSDLHRSAIEGIHSQTPALSDPSSQL
jgi:hypothetical protein